MMLIVYIYYYNGQCLIFQLFCRENFYIVRVSNVAIRRAAHAW